MTAAGLRLREKRGSARAALPALLLPEEKKKTPGGRGGLPGGAGR